MRLLYSTSLLLCSVLSFGQNITVLGNFGVSRFIDNSSFPNSVGSQFSSRLSIGVKLPIPSDTTMQFNRSNVEIGLGTLFNSIYFKESDQDNPKSSSYINTINGLFLKAEPSYTLFSNKSNTLFLEASLNFMFFYFSEYESNTGYFTIDSTEIRVITTEPNDRFQIGIEPYLSFSYFLSSKQESGMIFKLKYGAILHNKSIARMQPETDLLPSELKLEDSSIIFSIGWVILN